MRGARQQVAGHPVRPCAVEMLAAEGHALPSASCALLHEGLCCTVAEITFEPPSWHTEQLGNINTSSLFAPGCAGLVAAAADWQRSPQQFELLDPS